MSIGSIIARLSGLTRVRSRIAAANSGGVLPPYERPGRERAILTGLVAASLIYLIVAGYFLGVAPRMMTYQIAMPAFLGMFVLWAMPDREGLSYVPLERAFLFFGIASIIWPSYVALSIKGLPWISPSRLALALTIAALGYTLAFDRRGRQTIAGVLARHKVFRAFLIIFVILQFITVFFSENPGHSFSFVIKSQFYWTGMFLVAVLLASRPGGFDKVSRWLTATAVVLAIVAIIEYKMRRIPWLEHLPSFLQVQDMQIMEALVEGNRSWDSRYRLRGPFMVALSFAECTMMIFPFVVHYLLTVKKIWLKGALLVLYIAIIAMTFLSRSRMGMIGIGVAHLGYPLLIGLRRLKTIKADFLGPSLLALYPVMLVSAMFLILSSNRIFRIFFGGEAEASSNDARAQMFDRGIPEMLKAPWGHGATEAASIIGFRMPNGVLTIDSYLLSIGLDYGLIGLICFYGMIIATIYISVRVFINSSDKEAELAAPLGVAMGVYLVGRLVLSETDNQWLMYVFMGTILTFSYRFLPAAKKRTKSRPSLRLATSRRSIFQ